MLHSLKSPALVLRLAVACLAAPAFLAAPAAEAQVVSEIQVRRDWKMDDLRFHNRFCRAEARALMRLLLAHAKSAPPGP